MAITSSAKRAIRVAKRKRVFNLRRLDTMRSAVQSFRKKVSGGKLKEAEQSLAALYKALDKAAKRGVIKKNAASRMKSRMVALLKKASAKK